VEIGADHPSTLGCEIDLALFRFEHGHYDEAIAALEGIVARCMAKLPSTQYTTINARSALASCYVNIGFVREAIQVREALARDLARFGPDHIDVLMNDMNLANAYFFAPRWSDPKSVFDRIVPLCEAKCGTGNANTLTIRSCRDSLLIYMEPDPIRKSEAVANYEADLRAYE
jgi:hypothetical protein